MSISAFLIRRLFVADAFTMADLLRFLNRSKETTVLDPVDQG